MKVQPSPWGDATPNTPSRLSVTRSRDCVILLLNSNIGRDRVTTASVGGAALQRLKAPAAFGASHWRQLMGSSHVYTHICATLPS